MSKININDATAAQLAEFAVTHHGLDVNFRMGAAVIRAKLATAGYEKEFIEIEDAPTIDPNARVEGDGSAPAPEQRAMKVIRIENQEAMYGGKRDVPVGVNGKVYLIKRGEDVRVPVEVVEVLKNAKRVVYDRDENGAPINPTFVPTHPFSIVA